MDNCNIHGIVDNNHRVRDIYDDRSLYKAETSLFVGKESDKIASLDLGEFNLNKSLVSDYRQLILSRLVSQEVIDELGLDMTVSTFQKKLKLLRSKIPDCSRYHSKVRTRKWPWMWQNALAQVLVEKAQDIIQVKSKNSR